MQGMAGMMSGMGVVWLLVIVVLVLPIAALGQIPVREMNHAWFDERPAVRVSRVASYQVGGLCMRDELETRP